MGSICRTGIQQVLYYSTAAAGFLFPLSLVNLFLIKITFVRLIAYCTTFGVSPAFEGGWQPAAYLAITLLICLL